MIVSRAMGSVVVGVDGVLDAAGADLLELVLTDLIDGQGNASVAVDLAGACVEPEAVSVLLDVAHQAEVHGARFVLRDAPAGGLDDLAEEVPGPGSRVY
jgi:anti-anti-sigma regulatory factor